jgi:hypothetical protein
MSHAPHAARTNALGSESRGENCRAFGILQRNPFFVPPGDFPRELRERD